MMNQRERDALDRHITGNYGEDQFRDQEPELEHLLIDVPYPLGGGTTKLDLTMAKPIEAYSEIMGDSHDE